MDFTGELKVLLINLSKDKFTINAGERIAQLVVAKYEKITWEEVSSTDAFIETERGDGGYGSTGK